MTAWVSGRDGLCIELAVALEIANVRLEGAASPAERAEAVAYNLSLWRAIGRLADNAPDLDDRESLRTTAGNLCDRPDAARLAACNTAHAQTLTERFVPGALRRLLDDWHAYRCRLRGAEFGQWMLERLDDRAGPVSGR